MLSPHPVGQNSEAVNSNECVTLLSGPITWTESCHWWAKSKFRASFVCHVTGTQAHIYETETRDVYPWKKKGDHTPLDKDWAFTGFFFCSLALAQTPNNKANKTQRSITSCPLRELQWQSAKRLKICEMWLWKTSWPTAITVFLWNRWLAEQAWQVWASNGCSDKQCHWSSLETFSGCPFF